MIFHEVCDLKKTIDYKKEGVAVEKLLENGDFKALLLAMEKEQVLNEHISEVDAFIYVMEGEIEFSIQLDEVKKFNISKGEFFAFYANERHSLVAKKDSKALVVRI